MKGVQRPLFLGFFVATLLLLAACSESDDIVTPNRGQVQFVLSSAPASPGAGSDLASPSTGSSAGRVSPLDGRDDHHEGDGDHRRLKAANVTFTDIRARNLDGQLIGVTIDLPATVDLLGMNGDREVMLPAGLLPPGNYDQIVVVMSDVELVLLSDLRITITPPGGGWTAVIRVCPFTVEEGQMTTVRLRFRREFSFGEDKSGGGWHFDPHFDCEPL